MLIKKPDDIRSSEITEESVYKSRRRFLLGAGALLGLGAGGSILALSNRQLTNTSSNKRQGVKKIYQGLPKGIASIDEPPTEYSDATSYNNFYELGSGKSGPMENAKALITDPWSVTVDGECEKPGTLSLEEFLKPHALEERIYRLRCVETWSMVIPWVGFSLGDALKRFQPTSAAKYVEFRTLYDPKRMPGQRFDVLDWPYREGLRIDEAMHPLATLAIGMYGETLPPQNGAPLRLVAPWKYGFKSIKSIVSIRFTEKMPETTWNQLQPEEYGFYANVNPEVDHPRWSQASERFIGPGGFLDATRQPTLMFNGYGDEVASLYAGMNLRRNY